MSWRDRFGRSSLRFGNAMPSSEPEEAPGTEGPITRGARARQLAADPMLREALQAANKKAYAMFDRAKTDEELRAAKAYLQAAGDFSAYLLGIIGKGQAAAREKAA